MTSDRQLLGALAAALLLFAIGVGLFVWPHYRRYDALQTETAALQERISDLGGQAEHVARLVDAVEAARQAVDNELKTIPADPSLADVMRRLSLRVDGATVRDQGFASGTETDAVPGKPELGRAMPLTVEVEARFDSVFALLRSVETMNRLVRVSSVQLSCNHEKNAEPPFIEATLGLDAIYAGFPGSEGTAE